MEPPLADVEDLEYRLGRQFQESELNRIEAVLDDVSALVRVEAGRTWIDPDTGLTTGVPSAIKAIVLRIAERVVNNPDALKSESAGDYSYQYSEAGVYLSERERQMIRRIVGKGRLWTQPIERDDEYGTTLWVEDNYGAELFPLTAEGD